MGLAAPVAFGVHHGGWLRDPDRGHGAGPGQHLRRRRRVLPALAESVAMTHPTPKAEPAPRSDYRGPGDAPAGPAARTAEGRSARTALTRRSALARPCLTSCRTSSWRC